MDSTVITTAAITAFATTLASKGASAPAETFNNIWEYVFSPINDFLIKHNMKHRIALEEYGKSLHQFTKDIPPENLKEPDIDVIGPALEASRFYIEKKVIRDMFAKLIAANFDDRKTDLVHHSYVEIIKQMDTNDASLFKDLPDTVQLMSCQVMNGSKTFTYPDILLTDKITEYDQRHSVSINNLERLGLIQVSRSNSGFQFTFTDTSPEVQKLKSTVFYKSLQNDYTGIEILAEISCITMLGLRFKNLCL